MRCASLRRAHQLRPGAEGRAGTKPQPQEIAQPQTIRRTETMNEIGGQRHTKKTVRIFLFDQRLGQQRNQQRETRLSIEKHADGNRHHGYSPQNATTVRNERIISATVYVARKQAKRMTTTTWAGEPSLKIIWDTRTTPETTEDTRRRLTATERIEGNVWMNK